MYQVYDVVNGNVLATFDYGHEAITYIARSAFGYRLDVFSSYII